MKKLITLFLLTFILISCGSAIELTQEYIDNQYNVEDRSISLENNQLSGFINLNEFKNDIEVNNIYLSNNKIEVLNISDFNKLWKLDISNNNIRFISDLNLPLNTRHLNISNNNLDSLSWLDKYENIKTLNISNNNLDDNDLKDIVKLKKLIFIKAEWNNFTAEMLQSINSINHRFLLKNNDPFVK